MMHIYYYRSVTFVKLNLSQHLVFTLLIDILSLEFNAKKHSEFKGAFNFHPSQFTSNEFVQEESKSAIGLASSVTSQLNHE